MSSDGEATLSVVAGRLFEVSIPVTTRRGWRWANDGDEVPLQAEELRGGRHRFRFRAEGKGAEVGAVELRFVHDAEDADRLVPLRVELWRPPDRAADRDGVHEEDRGAQ